jgi:AAHS family 4-hydroxybenzoate transporter-like MFS transporter
LALTATEQSAKSLLDDLPLSSFQVWTVLMIAAAVVLDGLDNQMLGLAAPSLLAEWSITRDTLGLVFALGFVGMAFGTLAAGYIGDRFGRRGALIAGVGVFGVATLLTGFSTSLWHLALLKTLAGVGLGGVPGTASAMIAEFTPARWRSAAVTFGVVCVSIGGILGGVAAAAILPVLGWRWLFFAAGAVTIVFTALLLWLLPESPSFLEGRPHEQARRDALLRRMGVLAGAHDAATTPRAPAEHVPFSALFQGHLLRDSLALSLAMFSGMFMIYLMFNWSPTMLASTGFGLASASLGLTSFNIGGTLGALGASLAMIRFGSRPTLLLMAVVGAAACGFLALLDMADGRNELAMLGGLVALGLFASAAQSAMFAVGAYAFPTAVRARGLGLMGAAGRAGAILSSVAGAGLIGGGNRLFFGVLAALMLVNAVGFFFVRGHVPPHIRKEV